MTDEAIVPASPLYLASHDLWRAAWLHDHANTDDEKAAFLERWRQAWADLNASGAAQDALCAPNTRVDDLGDEYGVGYPNAALEGE